MINRYLAAAALMAACALGGASLIAADDGPREIRLSPKSDPHAVLSEAFFETGYDEQGSSDLATRSIQMLMGEEVGPTALRPTRETDSIALHPDSCPHAILTQAFENSGWPVDEAVQHANQLVMQLLGIEPDEWELQPLGLECLVYPVSVMHCVDGQPVRRLQYLGRNCYDDLEDCAVAEVCGQGESHWYTLTHGGNCTQLSAQNTKPRWVPCDNSRIIKCSDLDSSDCEDVDIKCCPQYNRFDGCPERD